MRRIICLAIILTAFYSKQLLAGKLSVSPVYSKTMVFDDNIKFKFILGDQTYELQGYSFSYYNSDDKPNPQPMYINQTDVVSLSVKTSKISQGFLDWLLNPNQEAKNGQIIIYDADSGKTIKTITLTGLKTSSYNENGNSMAMNYNNMVPITAFALRYKTINIKLGN